MNLKPDYINTYLDTRGAVDGLTFSEAIVAGIAPGGGLFVPNELPRFTAGELAGLAELAYPELAAWVYEAFGVDMPAETVRGLMREAYGERFDCPAIAPLRTLGANTHILELWHGPTSAFKDMALQCLPVFFAQAVSQLREQGKAATSHLVLVATSGDTGKAALEGFANKPHTGIVVFYPAEGVSEVQRLQMTTQGGANVGVFALEGNFDDCQSAVKGVFGDEAFSAKLASEYNIKLTSANSINWGRLLPQVVYYVSAWLQLLASERIALGEPIDVCVPTGNFGNILAAWYARELGVPIERLLCASNDNRVLTDFINSGTYDISSREFVLTPSPSMDILISSNLERLLFELTGRNAEQVRTWMGDLREQRRFVVDRGTFAKLREVLCADWVSADESLAAIQGVYREHGYLMDPHTAVGWEVAQRLSGTNQVVVASTAHWAKFGVDVYRALHGIAAAAALPDAVAAAGDLAVLQRIAEEFPQAAPIPAALAALSENDVRFKQTVQSGKSAAEEAVWGWIAQTYAGKTD